MLCGVAAGVMALAAAGRLGPGGGALVLLAAAAGIVLLGLRARLLPTAYAALGLGTVVGVMTQVFRGGK